MTGKNSYMNSQQSSCLNKISIMTMVSWHENVDRVFHRIPLLNEELWVGIDSWEKRISFLQEEASTRVVQSQGVRPGHMYIWETPNELCRLYKDVHTHKYILITIRIQEEILNLGIWEGTQEELKRKRKGENWEIECSYIKFSKNKF